MTAARIQADAGYGLLKEWVIAHTGLAYYVDKDPDFAARLARRFAVSGAADCAAYLRLLETGPGAGQELDALIGELTIGETYFFRQREHFDALRTTILPEILERNRATRRLRIWSAGCATGAEAYSIAVLLRLEMAGPLAGWDVSILGTDINRDFLARARAARFDHWAFREAPQDLQARCFRQEGHHWVLLPEFKDLVSFGYHNLMSGTCPAGGDGPYDLILCRNVMIYFSPETVRATAGVLYDCLKPGGWLLVGHAELNAEVFRPFRLVTGPGVFLYQKPDHTRVEAAGAAPAPPAAALCLPPPPPAPAPKPPRRKRAAPAKPRVTVEQARRLADRGDWEQAAALCRELLAKDRLNTAAYFTLALVLEHTGATSDAERSFRRAIYLDRTFVLAHYHLGLLLANSGAASEARRSFENALQSAALRAPDEPLAAGDGITAAELAESVRMHLELLREV